MLSFQDHGSIAAAGVSKSIHGFIRSLALYLDDVTMVIDGLSDSTLLDLLAQVNEVLD